MLSSLDGLQQAHTTYSIPMACGNAQYSIRNAPYTVQHQTRVSIGDTPWGVDEGVVATGVLVRHLI